MRPDHRTWRIRGIPRDVDRQDLARALRHHSDLRWPEGDGLGHSDNSGDDVIIHTLAPDLRVNYKVATVRFHGFPSQLQALDARDELTVKIKLDPEGEEFEVLFDEHFDGITTLFSPGTDKEHQIDILAVSGLGSHPFGSFVNKKDGNMWLSNNLPRDMPTARVMIFGYESKLQDSNSHIELDDLAGPVHIAISQITQSRGRPLLLIGHSLGGLLVKEALIRSAESGWENGLPNSLDMVRGIFLFGTPNDGLDIESLVPIVNDQPNRSLLESLRSTGSQTLSRQRKDFSKVLEHTKLQLFCLYETELSPTATQDPETRRWKMGGPPRFLVSKSSATSCLPAGAPSTRSVSIRRNHSDLVKFSSHDAEYEKVAYILHQVKDISIGDRIQERELQLPEAIRELQSGSSITGQHGGVAENTQVQNLVKRPADDMLPPPVGKRPRLQVASHLRDEGESQAHEDPALRHSESHDEIRSLKEELIRRLYFSKIDDRLTHLAPAQGTTCRWFLTEPKYQSWQDVAHQPEHGGFLWIKGHPGTGKSTLMKYLFQDTKSKSQGDPSHITLSFFFLARGAAEEKTTTGLYRSLLHQLFEVAPDLKQSLGWMTGDGARTIERNGWSEEALKQTLKYAVPKLEKRSLTMFVDALDECDTDKADDMVSFFEELCECAAEATVNLRICFSSRHYPTVVINKSLEVYLEVENGHAEDIQKYVKSKLKLTSKSKLADSLRSEILERSSGIFLWVVLVLDILNRKKSCPIQKLRDHLKEIPPGLDDLFRMILTRDGDNLEQLELCLNWILFASRALKPQELYFAVQLGSDKDCSGFWDQRELELEDMKTFVRSSSKGLAEVTRNKASEVQFIHESVRDFLLGKYRNQWSGASENPQGHGHRVLRDCCLAQLDASISKEIEIPDPLPKGVHATMMQYKIGSKFPFLEYSVRSILHHSNLAQMNGIDQGRFLFDFPLRRWVHLNNILERYEVRRYTDSVSLLYILGENNLGELIRIHPSRKLCFNVESERCGAPILAAFARNSRQAVRAFLWAWAENESPTSLLRGLCEQYEQHGNDLSKFGRDFTFKGRGSSQILNDLIRMDEQAAALALVLGPYNLDDPLSLRHVSTPLVLPINMGHVALVKLLLQKVSHVDKKNGWLDLPLLKASLRGDEAMVRILFDTDANTQPSRQGLQSALCGAVTNGDMGVVKLLLGKGADFDSKNENGERPLSLAAKHGKSAVFKFLLSNGADIESRDGDDRTPLSWAAASSCFNNVKLLLDKGADIESRDGDGRSPLSWATTSFKDNFEVAKLLLQRGADVNLSDQNGRTPLSWAAANIKTKVVSIELLLENGADIETADKNGRTPLSWAVAEDFQPDDNLAKLLLQRGAEVNSRDKNGRTPLSWAAELHQNEAVLVKLLLESGADIDIADKDGRTPLSWAAYWANLDAVALLLEKGAAVDSKDKDGLTPPSRALFNPQRGYRRVDSDRVISLLEKAESDIKQKGKAQDGLLIPRAPSDIAS